MLGCLQNPTFSHLWNNVHTQLMDVQCACMGILRTDYEPTYKPPSEAALTPHMMEFNKSMSTVRVTVEWPFGEVTRSFRCLDLKSNLKLDLSCVGKMYLVCALIQNALTCMYGNQTSKFFELNPPSVQRYFS